MKRHRVKIFFIIVLIFFIPFVFQKASSQVSRFEVAEKAQKVKELIQIKQTQGKDVSGDVEKAKRVKKAFKAGNVSEADRLLNELLIALEGVDKKGPEFRSQPDESGEREKTVSLALNLKKASLVMIDPKYKKGKEISHFDDAVKIVPADIREGMLSLKIGGQPVFILEEKPPLPLLPGKSSEDSPFGFHPAKVEGITDPYMYARDIGVSWTRITRYFVWPMVQKDIKKKEYDWTYYDNEINQAQGFYLLFNIIVAPPLTDEKNEAGERAIREGIDLKKFIKSNSYLPTDEKAYTDFVTACVERYDGDGIADMPGLKRPIKYWQLGNEPHPKIKDFAEFVKISSIAIKKADPNAHIVIGGALLQEMRNREIFDKHFLQILKDLAGKYIDVIDFHWGGDALGNYRSYNDIYSHLRSSLMHMGFRKDIEVWITEMSGYSGDPVKLSFQPFDPQPQTELQQASDLVKKYVYGLSVGIKKIFWAWGMMEGFKNNDSYFDHTGIIYDGKFSGDEGRGVKKLAYYDYKLMTTLLAGSDWDNVQTVINGKDNIYVYKFIKKGTGASVHVVWWDSFAEKGSGKTP